MKARSIISCIVLLVAVACQNSGVEQADQFLANTKIGIVETQDPIIKGLLDSYPSAESLSAKNVFGNADVKSLTQSDVSKLSFTKLSFYELDADAFVANILEEPKVMDYAKIPENMVLLCAKQGDTPVFINDMFLKDGKWRRGIRCIDVDLVPKLDACIEQSGAKNCALLFIKGAWYLACEQNGEAMFYWCGGDMPCYDESEMRQIIVSIKNRVEKDKKAFESWDAKKAVQ